MDCEMCGKEVKKSFGHDRDYTIGSTVENGDTGNGRYYPLMDITEVAHIVCLECWPAWKKVSEIRSTVLT